MLWQCALLPSQRLRKAWGSLSSVLDSASSASLARTSAGGAGRVRHGSVWPDPAVAAIMAELAIWVGWSVLQQARHELRTADLPAAPT